MAIIQSDIKLLKSAVMADVPEGGGAMTGIEVVDGQSNNLFPDTSELDRAVGRVALRKVFGVAHSLDTDTFLGAHMIVTQAPADPLVHVTLIKTPGWADTRTTARELIERYVVKGPRLTSRLMEQHFAGSLSIRLLSLSGQDFPAGGDAVALRRPDGVEQFVRVTKVTVATQTFTVTEGASVVTFAAFVATAEIGQALQFDFTGPPIARAVANEASFSQVFSTVVANGTQFFGIKPLALPAAVGDFKATVPNIFTPVVPAATIETPLTDVFPLLGRGAVVGVATAPVTLLSVTMPWGPGNVLTLPTPITPGTLALTAGATPFADDAEGRLLQGTLVVGVVDYKLGTATLATTAPNYGTPSITTTYKPAVVTSAAAFSAGFNVTQANQGLSYVNVFQPAPPPGSFTLSYMAQGRWVDLVDNLNGKLAGADPSAGVGTLSYGSGSMSITLGALPDVGSKLIALWGDSGSVRAVQGPLPAKAHARIFIDSRAKAEGISLAWSRGATNYTAVTNASGALTGDATGLFENGALTFEPGFFPDGAVAVNYTRGAASETAFSGAFPNYTLTGALPVKPGSVRGALASSFPVSATQPQSSLDVFDVSGSLFFKYADISYLVGSINYDTGAIVLLSSVNVFMYARDTVAGLNGWQSGNIIEAFTRNQRTVTLSLLASITYATGTDAPASTNVAALDWQLTLPMAGLDTLVPGSVCFRLGGENYTSAAGVLRRGWNVSTGQPLAAAGSVSSTGLVSITSLPVNGANTVVWHAAAQDASARSVNAGVFRLASAPIKTGVFQLISNALVAQADGGGVLAGGGFTGTVDFQRGIVDWVNAAQLDAASLSYNAVFLQTLPLDGTLLGLETARLPLDGKVPIYRPGGIAVAHNTQSFTLPNPLVKGTIYNVGRTRVAAMKVITAGGVTVDSALYVTDLDAGSIVFPAPSDLTGLIQPFTVQHRIEDVMLMSQADISGEVRFTRTLTHDYPAGSSFLSSAMVVGDVFARAFNFIEQSVWTGLWSDTLQGAQPLANYNEIASPVVMTNQGAITERWAMIFTSSTQFRIVGESVGEIGISNTGVNTAPINPATGVPYFSLPALGWGTGWSAGNVYRFNTAAAGAPAWVVRTVLQGPATLLDDTFTLALRGDVDRP